MIGSSDNLNANSNIDLMRLPPCQDSLKCHLKRVNYRLATYKCANRVEAPPSPVGRGWIQSGSDNVLESQWSIGPIMPTSLVDLAENSSTYLEEFETDSCLIDAEEELENEI